MPGNGIREMSCRSLVRETWVLFTWKLRSAALGEGEHWKGGERDGGRGGEEEEATLCLLGQG